MRSQRARDERGASAAIIAMLMSAILIVSAAFAVDLGQQRVVRRDMQAIADVVALDMVRLLNGGTANSYGCATGTCALEAAKNKSLGRNDKALGGKLADGDLTWDFVKWVDDEWTRIAKNSTSEVPTAVKVYATSDTPFAFAGIAGIARGGSTRTAVAQSDESACFKVGSFVASLDSSQSALLNPLLNGLLGSSLNLNAVAYQGLATSNISLLDLVRVGGLGVGTVDELLSLDNVSVGSLFVAAAKVLDDQGKLAQANILRSIAVAPVTPHIAIGDLISAAPGSSAALNAALNVLDLITASAMVANDDHLVEIPGLAAGVPGLVNVSTKLHIIESPRQKCGGVGTENSTSQVRLELTATVPGRTVTIPILGVANVSVVLDPVQVTLDLDVGKAIAKLMAVTCNVSGPDSIRVDLASSVVGGVKVTATLGAHAVVTVPLLGSGGLLSQVLSLLGLGSLLNPPKITLDTGLTTVASTPASANYDKTVTVPIPGGYTTPVGGGTGPILGPLNSTTSGTTSMTITTFGLLGNPTTITVNPSAALFDTVLNPVLSAATNSLSTIVGNLQAMLINPLAKLLGLQLGGADIFAVPTPTCSGPRLVG